MIPETLRAREADAARRNAALARARTTRCGWCDENIEPGEPTRILDDERVHLTCADEAEGR